MAPGPDSPQLLVSVRNDAEARTAAAGGADWLDLKEPARGPLGAVDAATAAAVAIAAPPGVRLSAAAGEWRDWREGAGPALLAAPRIELIKLGLAGLGHAMHDPFQATDELVARVAPVAREVAAAGKRLVLAGYADFTAAGAPDPAVVCDASAQLGLPWVLIDTFDKSAGRLLDHMPPELLASWSADCRAAGLQVAVAGRLRASDLPLLPREFVDVVGVRSAACGGDRGGQVAASAVQDLKRALHGPNRRIAGSANREVWPQTG